MKRIVLDCLPIPDPGEEARRIVRDGMNGILCSLSQEIFEEWDRATTPSITGTIPQIDMLVDYGRGITFCSKAVDAEARFFEQGSMAIRAELSFSPINLAAYKIIAGIDVT